MKIKFLKFFDLVKKYESVLVFFLSFFISLAYYSLLENQPFGSTVRFFFQYLNPKCFVNYCYPPCSDFNAYFIARVTLSLIVLFLVFLRDLRTRFFAAFLFLFLLLVVTQMGRKMYDFVDKESHNFSDSTDFKRLVAFEETYPFTQEIKKHLHKTCRAKFMTDLKLNSIEGMSLFRELAYFLYPIDIRLYPEDQYTECLIMFEKENADQFVPEGYRIVYQQNSKNLAAIKE